MICIDNWLDAALKSAEESASALGIDGLERGDRSTKASPELFGALVSVTSDATCIQVGVLGTPGGHAAVARTMLGVGESDGLDEADVVDAVRELANVIAGGLKRDMIERDPGLRIGLPVFTHGALEATPSLDLALQHLRVSGESLALVVLQARQRRAA